MNDQRTDEELNRIIAEWCGWDWGDEWGGSEPPNYTSDLNACHEAEGRLTDDQVEQYGDHIISGRLLRFETQHKTLLHATARHRAEALVKVIEKEESHV